MSREKKICIDKSQRERLVTDAYKLGAGIDEDVCPTVRDIVDEDVPEELRNRKGRGKKKKEEKDPVEKAIGRRISSKVDRVLDDIFSWF